MSDPINYEAKASRNLLVLNHVSGYTAWYYLAHEQHSIGHYIDGVLEPDFFSLLASDHGICAGDTIMCSCLDGAALLYVTEVSPGLCKVVPMALARSPAT